MLDCHMLFIIQGMSVKFQGCSKNSANQYQPHNFDQFILALSKFNDDKPSKLVWASGYLKLLLDYHYVLLWCFLWSVWLDQHIYVVTGENTFWCRVDLMIDTQVWERLVNRKKQATHWGDLPQKILLHLKHTRTYTMQKCTRFSPILLQSNQVLSNPIRPTEAFHSAEWIMPTDKWERSKSICECACKL